MYTQVTGFPGKVQGHGVFFLLEEGPGARIKAVSSNAVMLFRGTPEGLLGKAFTTLFSKPDALQGALAPGANISHLTPLTLEVALQPIGSICAAVTVQLARGPNGLLADVEEIDPVVSESGTFQAAQQAAAALESCNNEAELAQHVWPQPHLFHCPDLAQCYHPCTLCTCCRETQSINGVVGHIAGFVGGVQDLRVRPGVGLQVSRGPNVSRNRRAPLQSGEGRLAELALARDGRRDQRACASPEKDVVCSRRRNGAPKPPAEMRTRMYTRPLC